MLYIILYYKFIIKIDFTKLYINSNILFNKILLLIMRIKHIKNGCRKVNNFLIFYKMRKLLYHIINLFF
jgi:hypothetical protein